MNFGPVVMAIMYCAVRDQALARLFRGQMLSCCSVIQFNTHQVTALIRVFLGRILTETA